MVDKTKVLLDAYIRDYVKDTNLSILVPCTYDIVGGVTTFTKTDQAFTLNPVVHGNIKPWLNGNINPKGAVWLGIIGYLDATRMVEDSTYFNFKFSLIINEGLKALISEIGDLENRKVHIKRPGGGFEYVRDMENCAAYEIRLFVEEQ